MKTIPLKLVLLLLILWSSQLTAQTFNYGEALQKSWFFYEAQQSGPLPSWNRVNWRDDSAIQDGSDVGHDLTGGWYDAGDHVKFNFPMAFSATILSWGAIEYETAYAQSGQLDIMRRNLRFVCDYFIKCHTAPNEYWGQVANGGLDHAYWGSPEVYPPARPSYKIDAASPGSDLAAETAAALAAASIVFKNTDLAYSNLLLSHAIELYNFADTYRGVYSDAITDAAGYYRSFSGYQDELVWGAAWLYRATNDTAYLTKAQTEYANLSNEGQSSVKAYKWGLAWDDKSYGCYVLMSQLTNEAQYKADAERHLDYWTDGYNGEKITYSPGGQAHLTQWGSLRHSSNTAFLAFVYSDNVSSPKNAKYHDFAVSQIDYALGDNPLNRSFMVGFGNNPANNTHHRSAHGAWANTLIDRPLLPSHTLYGALAGGPKSPNDQFEDDRGDFIANEVACDYNAGLTGALARLYSEYGGTPLANFPIPEVPTRHELRTMTKFNSNNAFGSTARIFVQNRTAWPARVTDKLTVRYFFDISEGIAAGKTIADYNVQLNSQGSTTLTVNQWQGSVYYAEVSFFGQQIAPVGDPQYRREAQINISVQNGTPYDLSNDWSAIGLNGTTDIESVNIPVYDDGVLVFGNEPDGSGPSNTAPSASFTATPTNGTAPLDVNFDASGSFDLDGDALTYIWDLGNGETPTTETPSTTYTTAGTYNVTLIVNDGTVNSQQVSKTINVTSSNPSNTAPVAALTATPTSGTSPLNVSFNASGSTDADGDTLSYTIDYGDGSSGSGVTSSHTYTTVGTYTATVTVNDGNNGTDTASVNITVSNSNPPDGDCNFGTPTANALATIDKQFTGIHVLGSGGPNLSNVTKFSINWNLQDNGLYQFAINTNNNQPSWYVNLLPSITQNFNSAQPSISINGSGINGFDGNYWVTLDSGNFVMVSKTGNHTIYFNSSSSAPECDGDSGPTNTNPVAALSATPLTGTAPLAVTFNASGSTDADGDTLAYTISYGDGSSGNGVTSSHTYTSAGSYTATVTVSDGNGGSDSASVSITVTNSNPPNGDGCGFGTPLTKSIASVNKQYNNIHVLGNGGPNLSNITNFTINWDLANNGLYQFSMNTSNGIPSWYNSFLGNITQSFSSTQPDLTLSGTGISGLDGNYWAAIDTGNFVIVSKTGNFSIYFSNSATAPNCDNTSSKSAAESNGVANEPIAVSLYPNPLDFNKTNSVTLKGTSNLIGTQLEIHNVTGRTVRNEIIKIKTLNYKINLKNLPSGVYFITIKNNDIEVIKKLVIL